MIIHQHDYGWGLQWPIKKIEKEITDAYLAPLIRSGNRTVLINSTWYGKEQHEQTVAWLRSNNWDSIALVSMIDAAIPDATWFAEFDRPVHAIGSFRGSHDISLWAEVAARYIEPFDDHDIDVAYMCLNRKPHWHRLQLYQALDSANLLQHGLVSLGGADGAAAVRTLDEQSVVNNLAPNGGQDQHGIPNDIVSLGDKTNWRRHFINVVTETVYDVDSKYFVSEKIFKPILGCRPFVVYSDGGAESWLTDHGFQTYLDDFSDIMDFDLRQSQNIVPFLKSLTEQGPEYWRKKYLDLLPKIRYNQNRFTEFVTEQRQRIQQGIPCPI